MRYRDFCDFQAGGSRHVGFSKIQNLKGRSANRQYASLCKISLKKSVERLRRYGYLTTFFLQNNGRAPIGFV